MKQATDDSSAWPIAHESRWHGLAVALLCTVLALLLYWWTAAPSLTWAHEAADGGELLAAAWSNGVPHPPGYPLYMLLLRGWLSVGRWANPAADLARLGNLFSVVCAALSVGVTVIVAGALLPARPWRWLWAGLAGLAWALCPLLWGQAVVTEVYALHALLVALLGWATLNRGGNWRLLTPVIACGVAHHLTFVLLLPAVVYLRWRSGGGIRQALQRTGLAVTAGLAVGIMLYGRTPLAAAGYGQPPPVNWGYAQDWSGFWWLVSGAAYRSYLFAGDSGDLFGRLTTWAYTTTTQYTPVGLALGLLGLAIWDREDPVLRTFSILWVVPVSIYAIAYYTRDSEIYLLPVAWLMALWMAVGLHELALFVRQRRATPLGPALLVGTSLIALAALLVVRLPSLSLRQDRDAQAFVTGAAAALEPGAIVISLEDKQTFALWYGAWASGELAAAAPEPVLINYSLFQFDWYRRLLQARYPHVVNQAQSVEEILAAQAGRRAIFFSELLSFVPAAQLRPTGPLWRYYD